MRSILAVFSVTLGVYLWTASAAVGWLDSPELVAASTSLGILHPPGHPIATLLGHAVTFLPFADLAFRVAVASAICMAFAVAILFAIARGTLSQRFSKLSEVTRQALSVGVAFAFAFSWAAWFSAVRAEVYALEALLVALVLLFAIRFSEDGDKRALYAAGLCTGLGLANHHLITLLACTPVAIFVLWHRPRAFTLLRCAALIVVGLLAYAYIPARAQKHPVPNWGDAHSASRLAWVVTAQAFQKSVRTERENSRGEDAALVAGALAEQVTPLVLLLALLALPLLWRARAGPCKVDVALVGMVLLACAGPVLVGFNAQNPDAYGYLLPALFAVLLLCAAALATLLLAVHEHVPGGRSFVPAGAVLVSLLLAGAQLVRHFPVSSLRRADRSDRLAHQMLESFSPRALVITSYFESTFLLWAVQNTEELRPDITHMDRSLLTFPGEAESQKARTPELATLIDAPLRAGAPTPLAQLRSIAQHRPVSIELHINLNRDIYPYLWSQGYFLRLSPRPVSDVDRAASERRDPLLQPFAIEATNFADARAARSRRLWDVTMRARFYCAVRRNAASFALQQAERLSPGDLEIAALRHSCK